MRSALWAFGLLVSCCISAYAASLESAADAYDADDFDTAASEWRALADSGDPSAQYNLAVLYESGLGVTEDQDRAAELYFLAAEQGLADAQYEIGKLYMSNFYGARDKAEAIAWFHSAAEQGHFEAQQKLRELVAPVKRKQRRNRAMAKKRTPKKMTASKRTTFETSKPKKSKATIKERSDGRCPRVGVPDYDVKVTITVPDVPIDHSRSIKQLGRAKNFHRPGLRVLGRAATDFDLNTNSRYASLPYKGKVCFWVNGIDVTMIYRSMTIYVASEYEKGSCEYREILKHERQHIYNARRNLSRFEPRIQGALSSRAIPKASLPKKMGVRDDPDEEMQRLYAKLLRPVYDDMRRQLAASQARIDSPESYARLNQKCQNW